MARIREANPRDQRESEWYTDVWDYLEAKDVADDYEKTKNPDGDLNKNLLSDKAREIVNEAERRASGNR